MGEQATYSERSASPYRRILFLAKGGMGEVELAVREEGEFQRYYAIKRLRSSFRSDKEFRSMFIDEARLAGLIRHRNVVSVLDVGEDEDGPFQVMDYVEGPAVSKLLSRLASKDVRLPVQLALDIAAQTCRGLHAAHELMGHDDVPLHLVHRDVSPQNILIGFDGGIRVTDFGVAKALGRQTKTQSGVLKGKTGYMSPEQLRYRPIDRRSDIFSVGIVLFELLSGQRLYDGKGSSAPLEILEGAVPDIGEYYDDLPPQLVLLLMSLLAKDPDDRPSSAKVVAERLETLMAEVRLEQARVDLSDFVERWFAEDREAMRAQMRSGAQVVEAKPLVEAMHPADAPAGFFKRSRVWAGVAVVAMVLAGLFFVSTTQAPADTSNAAASNAAVSNAAASDTPPEPELPPELEPNPPEAVELLQPEDGEPAGSEAAGSAVAPTKMRRRGRSRGTMRDSRMRTKSGQPILGW